MMFVASGAWRSDREDFMRVVRIFYKAEPEMDANCCDVFFAWQVAFLSGGVTKSLKLTAMGQNG